MTSNFFTNKTSLANKWISFSSSRLISNLITEFGFRNGSKIGDLTLWDEQNVFLTFNNLLDLGGQTL